MPSEPTIIPRIPARIFLLSPLAFLNPSENSLAVFLASSAKPLAASLASAAASLAAFFALSKASSALSPKSFYSSDMIFLICGLNNAKCSNFFDTPMNCPSVFYSEPVWEFVNCFLMSLFAASAPSGPSFKGQTVGLFFRSC